MTIYSDNVGNYFLGDCIYANHTIVYPSVNFLRGHPNSSISDEITALLTQSGLAFRNVATQSVFNNYSNVGGTGPILFFGGNGDIDDRYVFHNGINRNVTLYNNSGATYTTSHNNTNELILGDAAEYYAGPNDLTTFELSWAGVSDGQSLGLFAYNMKTDYSLFRSIFWYSGIVDDANTNFNYYSASIVSKSVLFCFITRAPNQNIGKHYISNTSKDLLKTGDAQYSIVCSDGQTPSAQWATDFYIFDNNATLDYPAIGKVRNLLLAQGSYTIGKPVRIQGTAQPDNGFNCWLPVGTFAGKTVLMRCYSSVEI